MEPDLAGFREARERKRSLFSEPIVLLGPLEQTYPTGTPLAADGTPLDPTVAAAASARASAMINAEFFWREMVTDPATESATGVFARQHPTLIAGSAAFALAEGKTHFQARGETYKIQSVMFDGITGIDRTLIYGELS